MLIDWAGRQVERFRSDTDSARETHGAEDAQVKDEVKENEEMKKENEEMKEKLRKVLNIIVNSQVANMDD